MSVKIQQQLSMIALLYMYKWARCAYATLDIAGHRPADTLTLRLYLLALLHIVHVQCILMDLYSCMHAQNDKQELARLVCVWTCSENDWRPVSLAYIKAGMLGWTCLRSPEDQAVCKQPLRACPINLWTLCCTMNIVSRHSCNCYQTHGQVMKALISWQMLCRDYIAAYSGIYIWPSTMVGWWCQAFSEANAKNTCRLQLGMHAFIRLESNEGIWDQGIQGLDILKTISFRVLISPYKIQLAMLQLNTLPEINHPQVMSDYDSNVLSFLGST